MNKVELKDLVGGALQEKFNKSFEKVIDNLQDVNTSFKVKRKISISLDFVQNEARDDGINCAIIEADGGAWKMEATKAIKDYLQYELSEYEQFTVIS